METTDLLRGKARQGLDDQEVGELAVYFDDQEPQEVLKWAFAGFHSKIALITSFQIDGMVLLDMAWRINPDVRVITLDTGRLPEETYELMEEVRGQYGINIEVYYPDTGEVEKLVKRHGVNLFYREIKLRLMCCEVRKVRPLLRALKGLDAWITGLRRDQWASRTHIRKIELDHDHEGKVKINPLADWTEEEVWDYIHTYHVPYNKLYDKGYTSIGCLPCTRPVKPGENPRAGRWWWEINAPKECGMHCSLLTGGFEHELEALLKEDEEDSPQTTPMGTAKKNE